MRLHVTLESAQRTVSSASTRGTSKQLSFTHLLRETFAAHSANKRLLLRMNTSHMRLEIPFLCESLPACMAIIFLLARMDLHVRVYIALKTTRQ